MNAYPRTQHPARSIAQTVRPGVGRRLDWPRLLWAAPLGAAAAAAVSAVVFAVESDLGLIDHTVKLPSMIGMNPASVESVAITAMVVSLWGAIALAAVAAVAARPIRPFWILSTIVLILSFALPATVAGPPLSMRVAMMVLHVATWGTSVSLLTTLARRSL